MVLESTHAVLLFAAVPKYVSIVTASENRSSVLSTYPIQNTGRVLTCSQGCCWVLTLCYEGLQRCPGTGRACLSTCHVLLYGILEECSCVLTGLSLSAQSGAVLTGVLSGLLSGYSTCSTVLYCL